MKALLLLALVVVFGCSFQAETQRGRFDVSLLQERSTVRRADGSFEIRSSTSGDAVAWAVSGAAVVATGSPWPALLRPADRAADNLTTSTQ